MNNHPKKLEKMKRRHIVATPQLRLSCSGECEGRMMLNNFVQKNKMHFITYRYYEISILWTKNCRKFLPEICPIG